MFINKDTSNQQDVNNQFREISNVLTAVNQGQAYPHSKDTKVRQAFWDDEIQSINAAKVAGANVPTWAVLIDGIYAYRFSATAMNEVWVSFHVTHRWEPGTNLYPHIHWTTAGTNNGVVRWGIEYTYAKGHNQAAFPATNTIYVEQAASGTAYKHMITEVSDVQAFGSDAEVDSLILCRIFRDGAHDNDTCTDPAFGLFVDMHFQVGYWATANKAPNFYK